MVVVVAVRWSVGQVTGRQGERWLSRCYGPPLVEMDCRIRSWHLPLGYCPKAQSTHGQVRKARGTRPDLFLHSRVQLLRAHFLLFPRLDSHPQGTAHLWRLFRPLLIYVLLMAAASSWLSRLRHQTHLDCLLTGQLVQLEGEMVVNRPSVD